MTNTEATTRNGKPALKITCTCATHAGDKNTAVLVGATGTAIAALKGRTQAERIHGFVTLANHPARMIQVSNARNGVFTN